MGTADAPTPVPRKTSCLVPVTCARDCQYPEALADLEARLIRMRQSEAGLKARYSESGQEIRREPAGIALSGGGIRSATYSLGVFQSLAGSSQPSDKRHDLLRYVDYLSTVSGGGYFGGFFGRMFGRKALPFPAGNPDRWNGNGCAVKLEDVTADLASAASEPVRRLRENGRYLAPNGFGDLMTATTMVLRNWFSVLVIVVLFILASLLTLNTMRLLIDRLHGVNMFADPWLTISPWVVPPLALFVLLVIPLGWAYWLVPYSARRRYTGRLAQVAVLVLASSGLYWGAIGVFGPMSRPFGVAGFIIAFVTVLAYVAAWFLGARSKVNPEEEEALLGCALTAEERKGERRVANARNRLTLWMKGALLLVAGLLLVALIDTAGQLLYRRVSSAGSLLAAFMSWTAVVSSVVAFSRKITSLAPEKVVRPSVRRSVLYYGTAIGLAGFGIVVVSAMAHGIVWRFSAPAVEYGTTGLYGIRQATAVSPPQLSTSLYFALAVTVLGVIAVGYVWPFVNRSTMHAFYEARLRRAYLGASNPDRRNEELTVNHVGDGVILEDYEPERYGGPLHIVNATINETVGCTSQIQQRDRKGVGIAVGPAGITTGVAEHLMWVRNGMAGNWPQKKVRPERLDLGQWLAISGAAVSPGTGYRTSLGLSLLAGLFNIRLGYWWDSDLDTRHPRSILPVYSSLGREWLGRFRCHRRGDRWYLTDGGHSENTGAYELIRRRLPFIVVFDNEQDADYTFPGLANLVRRARVDFDTRVTFLNDGELDLVLGKTGDPGSSTLRAHVGTPHHLRRGTWGKDPVSAPGRYGERLSDPDRSRHSLAHAALARISYPGGQPGGVLLYVKPTLLGDEPVDVLRYHADHADFPHEPTMDQFFDEEQWESYRRLGEHIADLLFRTRAAPGHWSPKQSLKRPAQGARKFYELLDNSKRSKTSRKTSDSRPKPEQLQPVGA